LLLGRGERLFDGVPALRAEPVEVAASPNATHVVYRIDRSRGGPGGGSGAGGMRES
jgi:hypothetical protein